MQNGGGRGATYTAQGTNIARRLEVLPHNKACSGRLGFCAIYMHFPRLGRILLPSRVHAHPAAANANRYMLQLKLS